MFRLSLRLIRLFALAIFCASTPAHADLETHLGPLAGAMTLGRDGVWERADDGEWFRMTNVSDPTAITYDWYREPSDKGTLSISVYVAVRSIAGSEADGGIIFDIRPPDRYYAYTIGENKSVNLFIQTADGLTVRTLENVSAKGDGSDLLSVQLGGTTATLLLNGEVVGSIEGTQPVHHNAGIFAAGTANIGFTEFTTSVLMEGPGGQSGAPPPLPSRTGESKPPPLPGRTEGTTPPPLPGRTGETAPPLPPGRSEPPPLPGSTAGTEGGPPPIPRVPTPRSGLSEDEIALRLGVTLGVYLHEFAHAVIGETGLPAPGNEEDIADSFSAHALAQSVLSAPDQRKPLVSKIVASYGLVWYNLAQVSEANKNETDWQGEHSPDIRRFRTWLCILYGASPTTFDPIANHVKLNERTRQRCVAEYPVKFQAWEELLASRGRALSADLPGNFPKDHPGGKVNLRFETGTKEFSRTTENLIRSDGTVEAITSLFEQYFVWPRDLTVTFRECEEINAWYSPSEGSVTMCYEAIDFFSSFGRS